MSIAESIRLLRAKKNYTQEYVARAAGVDPSTYSKWERGVNNPRQRQLMQLCAVYEISIDEFYSLVDEKDVVRVLNLRHAQNLPLPIRPLMIQVALDGSEETLKKWVDILRALNQLAGPDA
jgi:transcriptional regulator with XRE-family HTH domain